MDRCALSYLSAGKSMLRTLGDDSLVELTRRGQQDAFEVIVERYNTLLIGYVGRSMCPGRAEDVVQSTFIKAHLALHKDARTIRLRPWLYRIARNTMVSALASKGNYYEQIEDLPGATQPSEQAERSDEFWNLVERIKQLPARQRTALLLREFEGRSYEEISQILCGSPAIINQLLQRARTNLRMDMEVAA